MSSNGKTALITGASGGIGYELGKLCAADGYNLVLVARSAAKLEAFAAELRAAYRVEVTALARDLSEPASPQEIFSTLQSRSITVDVLVNNAGYGLHGPLAESDSAETLQMIQLNVVALTHLTRLFLPGMIARKRGQIMNVGSTGSFAPVPLMAVYGATKAYVLSFSEALAEELRGTGVSVTALCPGVTITGFQARANVENIRLTSAAGMTAKQAAEIGYKALKRKVVIVVPGVWNQLQAVLTRLMPRSLVRRASHLMMKSGE